MDNIHVRRAVSVVLGVAVVAASAGAATPATADAKRKRVKRCPTTLRHNLPCPRLSRIVPTRRDGSVGRKVALQAFAATIAPLPGVKPRKGGYPYIRSGTGPILWVLRHWSKLTGAQRAAVRRALPDLAVPGSPKAAPSAPAPRARASKLTVQEVKDLAEQGRNLLNKHFTGPPLTVQITVIVDKVWTMPDAGAYSNNAGGCTIHFPESGLAYEVYTHELMLHELTHCYMFQLSPHEELVPNWAAEGAAEWVQAALIGEWLGKGYVSPNIQSDWKTYFLNFKAPLAQHNYDAVGYFMHLAHSGNASFMFATIANMFATKNPQTDVYPAFTNANGGPKFLTTIASSGIRRGNLGSSWVTDGQHIPSEGSARFNAPSASIGVGTVTFTAPAYGRTVVALKPHKGADQVELKIDTKASAWGLLHHKQGDHPLQDGHAFFCARQVCTCPDGHKLEPLGDDSHLALYAHKTQAKVELKRAKLADACKQTPSAMIVTGAFSLVVTERGACNLRSSQMGAPGTKLGALWSVGYSQAHPQGIGGVNIDVDGSGPGTYEKNIDKPGPYGHARVTRYGEPGGEAWKDFNPVGEPEPVTRNFGYVTVDSVSSEGASGTVDLVLWSEAAQPPSQVHLKGRWSCAPFDKIVGG
jgi:hypothetical protein